VLRRAGAYLPVSGNDLAVAARGGADPRLGFVDVHRAHQAVPAAREVTMDWWAWVLVALAVLIVIALLFAAKDIRRYVRMSRM
jgi:hypothetical protein